MSESLVVALLALKDALIGLVSEVPFTADGGPSPRLETWAAMADRLEREGPHDEAVPLRRNDLVSVLRQLAYVDRMADQERAWRRAVDDVTTTLPNGETVIYRNPRPTYGTPRRDVE